MRWPRGRFLNCPRAMASSMRSFASDARPWIVAGTARACGANRSFSSRNRCSRSLSVISESFSELYIDVLSRALASRAPADALIPERPVSTLFGGPATGGDDDTRGVLRSGLCASPSMRSDASATDSVPVHGVAAAISRVPRPALDGISTSANARACSSRKAAAAIFSSSACRSSALKPASSTALRALRPPVSRLSSLSWLRRRAIAPSSSSSFVFALLLLVAVPLSEAGPSLAFAAVEAGVEGEAASQRRCWRCGGCCDRVGRRGNWIWARG